MQRNIERESGILPAEQPRHEREVRGAADRKKLGESLNDAECDRLKRVSWCGGREVIVRYSDSYLVTIASREKRSRASVAGQLAALRPSLAVRAGSRGQRRPCPECRRPRKGRRFLRRVRPLEVHRHCSRSPALRMRAPRARSIRTTRSGSAAERDRQRRAAARSDRASPETKPIPRRRACALLLRRLGGRVHLRSSPARSAARDSPRRRCERRRGRA